MFAICAGLAGAVAAQTPPPAPAPLDSLLMPLTDAANGPPPPWRVAGLPNPGIPLTHFEIVTLDTRQVLQIRTDHSYGTLSHRLAPDADARTLQWQWRLEQQLTAADLTRKDGDDAALKVCAMFDLPLEKLGWVERNLLRLARRASGENLPAATLCYVWDQRLPPGTVLNNPYSARVRYMVLNSADSPLGRWVSHKRDLDADFLRSFGNESRSVPPLAAIVLGADADNTGGASLAYVANLRLVKQ